ncbi:MAG TPA: CAP domain-containing protein, partial [Thermoguttaceae bacterium]|nr:CAP domain-containing protein [Thermoguttaceae bacterium]
MLFRFIAAGVLLAISADGFCSESAAPATPAQDASLEQVLENSPDQKASPEQSADVPPAETGDPAAKSDREASENESGSAKVELIAIEKNIIDYTNQERARYGLPPLEVCPKLMESARRHAAWMTIHRSLRHTSDPVAENIALGQRSSQE